MIRRTIGAMLLTLAVTMLGTLALTDPQQNCGEQGGELWTVVELDGKTEHRECWRYNPQTGMTDVLDHRKAN